MYNIILNTNFFLTLFLIASQFFTAFAILTNIQNKKVNFIIEVILLFIKYPFFIITSLIFAIIFSYLFKNLILSVFITGGLNIYYSYLFTMFSFLPVFLYCISIYKQVYIIYVLKLNKKFYFSFYNCVFINISSRNFYITGMFMMVATFFSENIASIQVKLFDDLHNRSLSSICVFHENFLKYIEVYFRLIEKYDGMRWVLFTLKEYLFYPNPPKIVGGPLRAVLIFPFMLGENTELFNFDSLIDKDNPVLKQRQTIYDL